MFVFASVVISFERVIRCCLPTHSPSAGLGALPDIDTHILYTLGNAPLLHGYWPPNDRRHSRWVHQQFICEWHVRICPCDAGGIICQFCSQFQFSCINRRASVIKLFKIPREERTLLIFHPTTMLQRGVETAQDMKPAVGPCRREAEGALCSCGPMSMHFFFRADGACTAQTGGGQRGGAD